MNCHGCKWLDENCKTGSGTGYCSVVELSKDKEQNGHKVRTAKMSSCEFYEEGSFAERYRKEK